MDLANEKVVTLLVSLATITLLHTLLPSHWLCFSLMGRAQKWSLKKTLGITAIAGTCHVLSTVLLGVLAMALGKSILPEESLELASSFLLLGIGAVYLLLHLLGKGHQHEHDLERMTLVALILTPTFSPCTAVIPIFVPLAGGDVLVVVLAAVIFLVSTLGVMLVLVALSSLGVEKMQFAFLDKYEKAIVGGILCLLGLAVLGMHHLLPPH